MSNDKMASNYLTQVTDKKGNVLEIEMRADGYFNATKMCKSTKKLWGHYFDTGRTREFLEELSECTKVSITPDGSETAALVVSRKGGPFKGTWVHRQVS